VEGTNVEGEGGGGGDGAVSLGFMYVGFGSHHVYVSFLWM
jgi:hypothetical protein